jgi:3-dehydrosphinganine reductase
MTKLRGAHAIVTGGSSGIGLATARLLAAGGASVSLLARGADRLDQAATDLRATGATVRTAAVDVADPVALRTAFEGLVAEGGPCDILVTAAGLARPGHFLELEDEVFRSMIEVDYFGTLQAIRLVAPGNGGPASGFDRGGVVRDRVARLLRLHGVRAGQVRSTGPDGGVAE